MTVQYETLRAGDGKHFVHPGDVVSVHYSTALLDGRIFDSSRNRGRAPFSFIIGSGTVVEAWDQVIPNLSLGQAVKITSSADTAYGSRGIPPYVPGGSTVKFEVELVGIKLR